MKKTLAVFTGTRAEYGLLRPLLSRLYKSEIIKPLLVVTGSHLSAQYGNTVSEIEKDNMPIAARLDILRFGQGSLAIAKTISYAIDIYSEWLNEVKPDSVLVLGDRYEIFAASVAAAALSVPIAHISGGDVTVGAKDDYYRHCITKMAACHFPSCEVYAQRLIRMGEAPDTVHNVGGLGDENIRTMKLYSHTEVSQRLAIADKAQYVLVTFHPETASRVSISAQMNALFSALDSIDLNIVFTKANADEGGEEINARLAEYCTTHTNAECHDSLGSVLYLSAMKYASAVIGNSSSGLAETPSFGVPCVNIGMRQAGRILCGNILSCACQSGEIISAITKALSPAFAQSARCVHSPYNGGETSARITQILNKFITSDDLGSAKVFYDGEASL